MLVDCWLVVVNVEVSCWMIFKCRDFAALFIRLWVILLGSIVRGVVRSRRTCPCYGDTIIVIDMVFLKEDRHGSQAVDGDIDLNRVSSPAAVDLASVFM
jgi:hypothetical protein